MLCAKPQKNYTWETLGDEPLLCHTCMSAQKGPVKWFQVGIQLQIDMPILEAYEAEYSNQMRLFAKVFEHWRREEKLPYTWNTIIIALERVDKQRTQCL